jgi:hypothetical protein
MPELGDMCALVSDAFYTPADFPYVVQRIWSNQAALAGHDPCQPTPAGQVYFNSAPVLADDVTCYYGPDKLTTKGVKIPVGQTKTVEVDLFSDGPTAGPWKVTAVDLSMGHLDLSLDKSGGQNGDKLNLTVHVKSKDPNYGAELFMLRSTLGTQRVFWVGIVGN